MSGVSFLPFSEHTYKQSPYQDCNKKEYEGLLKKKSKNATASLELIIKPQEKTEGLNKLIEGYEKILRSQIPG